jgi:hypothetical protein
MSFYVKILPAASSISSVTADDYDGKRSMETNRNRNHVTASENLRRFDNKETAAEGVEKSPSPSIGANAKAD